MSNVFSRACTLLVVVFAGLGIAACASPPGPSAIPSAGAVSSGLTALSKGITDETVLNAGWSCLQLAPTLKVCAPSGTGLPPIPPVPNNGGRPSYTVTAFVDHQFDHHVKLLRPDLYQDQPCVGGEPWAHLEIINYFECIIPVR
jgi:hypothetical protein